jgi:glucose-1-phosphate thymidylyltransferase
MLPYKGKPLIDYIIQRIPPNMEVLISTNQRFGNLFADWQKKQVRKIEICIEAAETEQDKLGAVSSIDYWIKQKRIYDDLLVIAADNYFEFDIAKFIAAFDQKHTLMAVYDIASRDKAKQFGVVTLEQKRVVEIEEKPAEPKSTLVSTACYIFPARTLSFFADYCAGGKKDNLGNFISYLVGKDHVESFQFSEPWFDIGSEAELVSSFTISKPEGPKL